MGLTIDSPIVPKSKDRHAKAKEIVKLASGLDIFEPRML